MHREVTLLVAALGLAAPALAAFQQSDVVPPGGFAAACAAASAGTNAVAYGGNLAANWSSPNAVGTFQCDGQMFGGPSGSGVAVASFAANNIANSAQTSATLGVAGLSATNASPGNTYFAQGAANAGWSDSSTLTVAGLSGSAIWLFDVAISGTLHTIGGGASFAATAYKNEVELMRSVTGFDPGGSDTFTTDRQRVRWSAVATGSTNERTRQVDEIVTFAVPVTLGTAFVWGVYGSGHAGQRAATTGETRIVTAELDFTNGLRYAGSRGVLVGGVLHDDYQIASASGIDWQAAAPVPEPAGWALMAAGLVAMLGRMRRRHG